MAGQLTVLQVHLDTSESSGSALLATCRSLAGQELGTKELQWEDTLQELEDGIKGECPLLFWVAQSNNIKMV